jgi:hypothetical protein
MRQTIGDTLGPLSVYATDSTERRRKNIPLALTFLSHHTPIPHCIKTPPPEASLNPFSLSSVLDIDHFIVSFTSLLLVEMKNWVDKIIQVITIAII